MTRQENPAISRTIVLLEGIFRSTNSSKSVQDIGWKSGPQLTQHSKRS